MKNTVNNDDYRLLGKSVTFLRDELCRIDKHLGQHFPFHSRTVWRSLLRDNKVLINGLKIKPSYILREGDQISYYSPQSEEPQVNTNIRELWRQGGVMAVEKPANLPMHEGGAYRKNTFHELLVNKFGKEWAAVHRLDRETSGLVLCGANPELRDKLSLALRERRVLKHYLAIASNGPDLDEVVVDRPIGPLLETSFRTKNWVTEAGQHALTRFRVRK